MTEAALRTPCLLLPGLLCDRALWGPQLVALATVAHCIVPDLGRDDTVAGMARAALALAPPGPFALAGLSMGGYVALEILRQAPGRVARLALLDTQARPDTPEIRARRHDLIRLAESARSFAPIHKRMFPLLVHPDRLQDLELARIVDEMADRVGLEGYRRQQQAILDRPDSRPDLPAIACPTLVLCGRQDLLTPLDAHEEMACAIPGAVLEIIEHCAHLSTLECPVEVNAALRRWLER